MTATSGAVAASTVLAVGVLGTACGLDGGAAASVTGAVLVAGAPWWAVRRRLTAPPAGRGVPLGRAATGRPAPGLRRRAVQVRPGTSSAAGTGVVDPAVVLDLCAAALRGGVAVPVALAATGRHLGGDEGAALVRAGTALGVGTPWEVAWVGAPPSAAAVGDALRVGWEAGASPGPQLRAAAERHRRDRRERARTAAGALGARLTLPLGACFLPAFVLLGLVPVVLGLAGDLTGP